MSQYMNQTRVGLVGPADTAKQTRIEAAITIAKRAVARNRQSEVDLMLSIIAGEEMWRELVKDDGERCTSMQDVLDDMHKLAVECGTDK